MNSGLYQISIGDYFYFGQSQDLKTRKSQHLHHLKKGTHRNPLMQNVYSKYQEFDFKEVLHCPVEELNQQEQRLLDSFWGTEGCMNISKCAEAPQRGLKRSEESKKKMSEAHKGKHHSEETKRKLSEAHKGKKKSEEHKRKLSESRQGDTKHTFIHDEHGEVTTTQFDLRTKYNLDQSNTSKVIKGKLKSHQGWSLKDPF